MNEVECRTTAEAGETIAGDQGAEQQEGTLALMAEDRDYLLNENQQLRAELKQAKAALRDEVRVSLEVQEKNLARIDTLKTERNQARRELEEAKYREQMSAEESREIASDLKREVERLKSELETINTHRLELIANKYNEGRDDLQRRLDALRAAVDKALAELDDGRDSAAARTLTIATQADQPGAEESRAGERPSDEAWVARFKQQAHQAQKLEGDSFIGGPLSSAHQSQASERNQCDGCARGLPTEPSSFGPYAIHRGPGEWDLQSCTAHLYGHKPAIPVKEPATVTPPTREEQLVRAITLVSDAAHKLCVQHISDHGSHPRIDQAMRYINESACILSRLESRADSDGGGERCVRPNGLTLTGHSLLPCSAFLRWRGWELAR